MNDVTNSVLNPQKADIVLHYVLRAGGVSFAGYAVCGANDCPNIMVSSDFPASSDTPPAWAFEGSEPYPPAEGPYDCSLG